MTTRLRVAVIGDIDDRHTAVASAIPELDVVLLPDGVGLPPGVEAVYLAGADQVRARTLREELRAVCVTREEMTAVALAAQVLSLLTQTGKHPNRAKVVIVEAAAVPTLCPVLMAAGVGDIASWHPADALSYPLRRITHLADAVIDPVAGDVPIVEPTVQLGQPPLIAADDPAHPLLALPGLLLAVARTSVTRLDIDTFYACAAALAACTPHGERLPDPLDPELTPMVTRLVARALATQEETR